MLQYFISRRMTFVPINAEARRQWERRVSTSEHTQDPCEDNGTQVRQWNGYSVVWHHFTSLVQWACQPRPNQAVFTEVMTCFTVVFPSISLVSSSPPQTSQQ